MPRTTSSSLCIRSAPMLLGTWFIVLRATTSNQTITIIGVGGVFRLDVQTHTGAANGDGECSCSDGQTFVCTSFQDSSSVWLHMAPPCVLSVISGECRRGRDVTQHEISSSPLGLRAPRARFRIMLRRYLFQCRPLRFFGNVQSMFGLVRSWCLLHKTRLNLRTCAPFAMCTSLRKFRSDKYMSKLDAPSRPRNFSVRVSSPSPINSTMLSEERLKKVGISRRCFVTQFETG